MGEGGGVTPRKVSARVYRRRRIAAALALLVVAGLTALAGGWGYTAFRFRQMSSVHVPGLGKAPSDGSVNLLVVGSDTRQGLRDGGFGDAPGQRSDVIILVHLVPAARHATVLSIPRDLFVPVAGTDGSAKINSAFNHGPGQLVQTIQQSLGIPVHHYLLVNFDGFREVVDALGGVSMYFPRPVRDDNNGRNESGLEVRGVGCRRLDGDQALALALARSRYFQYQDKAGRWHADPGTDLGRIRRQQTMLRALAANAVGRNLANPLRANALVGSVVHSLTKDDRLTIRRAVILARQFRAFDPARLTTITLPVDRAIQHHGVVRRAGQPGFEAGLRSGWEQVLLPRQPATAATVTRFLARPTRPAPPAPPITAPPPKPPAPAQISVVVKNATTRQGLAARTTTALRHLGFKASNGGNAPSAPRTALSFAGGSTAAAGVVAPVVKAGRGVARHPQPGLSRTTVVLVLGGDFKGVVARVGKPAPVRPPKPTAATRSLPAWDPRPC